MKISHFIGLGGYVGSCNLLDRKSTLTCLCPKFTLSKNIR